MKILNFIKNYKYWFLIIVLYTLLFIQMQNVVMYADDYNITLILDQPYLETIISELIGYYNNWSGRLVGHAMVMSGLTIFGINFFRILNPVMIFIFCWFVSKIVNIKINIDISKFIFILTILILGINIEITRECLYWADGTILYLWGFIPIIINLYLLIKAYINKQTITSKQLFVCLFLSTVSNFIMESTQVFYICTVFFILLFNWKNNFNDKKILFLFLYTIVIFIFSIFIPGNFSRLAISNFIENNLFVTLINRFYSFVQQFLYYNLHYYLFIISSFIIFKTYRHKKTIRVTNFYTLFLFNIFCVIDIIFDISINNYNLFFCLIYILYFTTFIIVSYRYFSDNELSVSICLSGAIASAFSMLLTPYIASRFYLLWLLYYIIFILYLYLVNDNFTKKVLLLLVILCLNHKLFIVILLLNILQKIIFSHKLKIININLLIVFLIFFSRFISTLYYYYKNSLVEKNNIILLEQKFTKKITLKKIPYKSYSYHQPDDYEYIIPWFNKYYDLDGYTVIWED